MDDGGLRRREPPSYVVERLLGSVAASWDSWDGQLALAGIDPRDWTLTRLLNAAEAAMDQAAEDDAERQRNRAALYAPPKGVRRRPSGGGTRRGADGISTGDARALMSQMAAEDARFQGRR